MRIQFLKTVPVKLAELPAIAWGRVQLRHEQVSPAVDPQTGQFALPAAKSQHVFPAGAVVNLPDELASRFVESGDAEPNIGQNGERIEGDRPQQVVR